MIAGAPKPFRKEGLGYIFEPLNGEGALGIALHIDSIHRRGDAIVGDIYAEAKIPGIPSHLLQSTQNISGARSRKEFASLLADRAIGLGIDWQSIIETFCVSVLRAEREGTPFIEIGDLDDIPESPDLLERLLQKGRINEVHGPAGDGKGWLATFMSVCCAVGIDMAHLHVSEPGAVTYLDWEDDWPTLNRRLIRAAHGLGISPVRIHYRSMAGALKNQVLQVARHITQSRTHLLIADSVELACGVSNGEHGSYEERAHGLHESLRMIQSCADWPVTIFLIDHISEEARRNDKGVNKAYGSGAKQWWARNTWELRKDQDAGSPIATLGLFPFKANHSPVYSPIGLRLDYSRLPEAVTIEKAEVRESGSLSKRLSNWERISAALRGPMFVAEIAEETEMDATIVRTEINRAAKRGRVVKTTDGRWVKSQTVPTGSDEDSSTDIPF